MVLMKLWKYCLQFNTFETDSESEEIITQQRLSTRIYILSFACFLILTGIAAGLSVRSINGSELSPSLSRFIELAEAYPTTLQCPCSRIGVAYSTFVRTRVDFHQVCSSTFVTQPWIDSIYAEINDSLSVTAEIRYHLVFFWQAIAGFCLVSNSTWTDAVSSFAASQVISPTAIVEEVVRSQAQAALNNSVLRAETTLNRNLLSIRSTSTGNQFISGLATNFYLSYPPPGLGNPAFPKMLPKTYGNCSCLTALGCPHPVFVNVSHDRSVPVAGMIADCLVIDGALASTLECYYDINCFSLLHQQPSINYNLLSNASNKHFQMNSTVEMLMNEIMIDHVHMEILFDLFYEECKPTYCYFTYNIRFSLIFITTTLISIFGGASFFLRLLASRIVQLMIRWRSRGQTRGIHSGSATPRHQRLSTKAHSTIRTSSNKLVQLAVNLNLFEKKGLRTVTDINRERLLTRCFIILFAFGSVSIGFYIFISEHDQLITVEHPSYHTYQQLIAQYSTSLQCVCSQISVRYDTFLNVSFVLHQICSSSLTSSTWLNYLQLFDPNSVPTETERATSRDFRSVGASYFQLLAMFCSLAELNIANAQRVFMSNRFINRQLPRRAFFLEQAEDISQSFINQTSYSFARLLNWIEIADIVSRFLTGTNINFYTTVDDAGRVSVEDPLYYLYIYVYPNFEYGLEECRCRTQVESCILQPIIYADRQSVFRELKIGCIPLAGILKSQSAWWYNMTYIASILETYPCNFFTARNALKSRLNCV